MCFGAGVCNGCNDNTTSYNSVLESSYTVWYSSMYHSYDMTIRYGYDAYAYRMTAEVLYSLWKSNTLFETLIQAFSPMISTHPQAATAVKYLCRDIQNQFSGTGPTITVVGNSEIYGGRRPEVDKLPGLTEMVRYPGTFPLISGPAETSFTMTLERAIIRLNDKDKWTREQIADWLETLDVDITFRSNDAG